MIFGHSKGGRSNHFKAASLTKLETHSATVENFMKRERKIVCLEVDLIDNSALNEHSLPSDSKIDPKSKQVCEDKLSCLFGRFEKKITSKQECSGDPKAREKMDLEST